MAVNLLKSNDKLKIYFYIQIFNRMIRLNLTLKNREIYFCFIHNVFEGNDEIWIG